MHHKTNILSLVYLVSQSEQSTRTKDTIAVHLTCQASLTFFFFFSNYSYPYKEDKEEQVAGYILLEVKIKPRKP